MEKYPDLIMSDEEKWFAKLKKVIEYIKKYERLPRQRQNQEKNVPKEELSLRKWVSHQKENYNNEEYIKKNPDRIKKWEEFMFDHEKLFDKQIKELNLVEKKDEYHSRKPKQVNVNNDHTSIKLKKVTVRSDGHFKKAVKERDGKCVISGNHADWCDVAHIKPLEKCETDEERFDPDNGLYMDGGWHKMFDKFKFAIHPETYKIVVMHNTEDELLKKHDGQKLELSEHSKQYIQYRYDVF